MIKHDFLKIWEKLQIGRQVGIGEADEHKTAFILENMGFFECIHMAFGLSIRIRLRGCPA